MRRFLLAGALAVGILAFTAPAGAQYLAGSGETPGMHANGRSGKRNGPGDGTGNKGQRPQDGTGHGAKSGRRDGSGACPNGGTCDGTGPRGSSQGQGQRGGRGGRR
jgi:hypothetical protein